MNSEISEMIAVGFSLIMIVCSSIIVFLNNHQCINIALIMSEGKVFVRLNYIAFACLAGGESQLCAYIVMMTYPVTATKLYEKSVANQF